MATCCLLADGREARLPQTVASRREGAALLQRATLRNTAGRDLWIKRIRLFATDIGGTSAEIFRQGFRMPGDPCGFYALRTGEPVPELAYGQPGECGARDFLSHTMVVLRRPRSPLLLLGATTHHDFETYFIFNVGPRRIRLSAWCDPGGVPFLLPSGESLRLEEIVTAGGRDFNALVAAYADLNAARQGARVPRETVTGWIDWQYYREEKDERSTLANVRALATLRRRGLPLHHAMVDGGWCEHASEWLGACPKFPRGMKALARRMRRAGLVPGLWFAPFISNVATRVARSHPEWMLRDARTGRLLRGPKWSNVGEHFVLDFTAPGALAWLREIVRTMTRDWGIGYLKLDGPALRHYRGGRFHDPRVTAVRQIRLSLEAIREACGDDVLIEGEGLYGVAIGIVDTQRVQMDNFPFWHHPDTGAPLVRSNHQTDLMSAFLHGRLWHNHRENVILRDTPSPFHARKHVNPALRDTSLPDNELRLQLSAGVLGGGAMLLSDNLPELLRSPERSALIPTFLPHHEGGRRFILDPFPGAGRQPSLYGLQIATEAERWFVVGVFNWSDGYESFRVPLARLPVAGPWQAHEFWTQTYLGRHAGGALAVPDVPPHACRLIALRRDQRRPQLVGTGIHLLQGAVELRQSAWRDDTLALSVRHSVLDDASLTVTRPRGWRLLRVAARTGSYLVDDRRPEVLRIRFSGLRGRADFSLHWRRENGRRGSA